MADYEYDLVFGKIDIFAAAGQGDWETFRQLVDAGEDFLSETDDCGNSVLHVAAGVGHVEFCRRLLELGIDVNSRGGNGETALHRAAAWEGDEGCRLFVQAGLSPSDPGPAKWQWWEKPMEGGYLTPFQSAVYFGNMEAVGYFVQECGEDPRQKTLAGKTMLGLAKGRKDMGSLLRSLITEAQMKSAVSGATDSPPGSEPTRRSGGQGGLSL